MTYHASAVREGDWWVVRVDGIGVTQGRSIEEAERMAPDLVAAMLDVPVEDVEVDVDFHLPGGLDDEIAAARDATFRAVKAQRLAAEQQRSVVRQLKQVGLKNKDIAAVLKVSNQRVSQLAAKSTARNPAHTGKLVTSAAAKGRSVKAKFRTGAKRRG